MKGPSLAAVREKFQRTAIGRLQWQGIMWDFDKPTYADFANHVEQALLAELPLFAERRHDFHTIDEDGISGILIIAFKHLHLAVNSAVVNGNCDIKVQMDDYVWLGEAKITRSNSKIYEGYLQLTQRYSPGIANQDRGGMLLFCVEGDAATTLASWSKTLETELPSANIRNGIQPLTFLSSDTSSSSGLALEIFHVIFPLTYAPVDHTQKLSKAASNAGKVVKKKGVS